MSIRVLELRRAEQHTLEGPAPQKAIAEAAIYATRLIVETLKQDGLQLTMIEPVKLLVYESLLYWLPLQSIKAFYLDLLSRSPAGVLTRTGLLFAYSRTPITVKGIREGSRRPVLDSVLARPIGSTHILYALMAPDSYLSGWTKTRALSRHNQPPVLVENALFDSVSIGIMKQARENPLTSKKLFRVKSHTRPR